MKALVYHGPGEKSWTDAPDPQIQKSTDIIVRIDTTTISGTDLDILKGDVPAVTPGRIIGHEGASGIGWVFGHLIDGTQAEYVRVPYAETSVYKVPEGVTNQQGVLLSDILPTGFEIGVQYGQVKPGDVVAVIGAGPVGLAVMATAG